MLLTLWSLSSTTPRATTQPPCMRPDYEIVVTCTAAFSQTGNHHFLCFSSHHLFPYLSLLHICFLSYNSLFPILAAVSPVPLLPYPLLPSLFVQHLHYAKQKQKRAAQVASVPSYTSCSALLPCQPCLCFGCILWDLGSRLHWALYNTGRLRFCLWPLGATVIQIITPRSRHVLIHAVYGTGLMQLI